MTNAKWKIERIEGHHVSWKTGSIPSKKIIWRLIDPEGMPRDTFSKKKDAVASMNRLNNRREIQK